MKDTQIRIRLTHTERQAIRQAASDKKTTISNLVRDRLGLPASNSK